MYSNATVSVVVPVYNAEQTIGRTLSSVLRQGIDDMEIILVDDCSTDRSAAVIDEYARQYPSVVYHRQERNQGAAVARNTALRMARGRYVAFIDSDDEWCEGKLKRQLAFMRERNAALSCTALDVVDSTGQATGQVRHVVERIDYALLLRNTMIATSTVVVDRNLTGDFTMPLRRSGQDYATWLRLLRGGTVCYGLDEVLAHYRVAPHSLSSNKWKSIRQVWDIQTRDEGIPALRAAWNVGQFVVNALKKRM